MAKCISCGKPIPDGAIFCGHCGKPTGFDPNKLQESPFVEYKVTAYEDAVQNAVKAATPPPKPNCDLSVAGFILSIFSPYLCLISFIISAVAIGRKQLRRKLAIAGLVISLIEIVAIAAVCVAIFVFHIDFTQYLPFLK